ncbi:MAG: RNA-binding protein [Candidatus Competibacteraceae bacterium]|nr:RNA-binding protein [Candidatus Competibacteraceae bacterium]
MTIYVGNVPFNLREEELQHVFAQYGEVSSVKIIKDKFTGKSKGFAFVEMSSSEDGNNAVQQVNGLEVKGRQLRVNEAKPKQ